jgi:HSP20 family protein
MFLVPVSRHAPEFARSLDRLFDDTFERYFGTRQQEGGDAAAAQRVPALDVAESEKAYTVTAELPGVTKDDVKVSIDGRRVTIQAQTNRAQEKKDGERVVYSERSSSSYSRTFTLPAEVDQEASQAKLEHGVLTLSLAKRSAQTGKQLSVS